MDDDNEEVFRYMKVSGRRLNVFFEFFFWIGFGLGWVGLVKLLVVEVFSL